MDEINKKISNYICNEIKNRISENNDAYKWILSEIKYYNNPNYPTSEYTEKVLNKLQEINNMELGEHPDVVLRLLCSLQEL